MSPSYFFVFMELRDVMFYEKSRICPFSWIFLFHLIPMYIYDTNL